MRILAEMAAVAILVPLIATAQDAARDIARQMGADTTTSISPGLDRHEIHRDTETVNRSRQHVPNLLKSAQGSKAKKPSKTRKKSSTGAGGIGTGEGQSRAETQQGAKRRKQRQITSGAARKSPEDTEIRLHAPSLLNPQ